MLGDKGKIFAASCVAEWQQGDDGDGHFDGRVRDFQRGRLGSVVATAALLVAALLPLGAPGSALAGFECTENTDKKGSTAVNSTDVGCGIAVIADSGARGQGAIAFGNSARAMAHFSVSVGITSVASGVRSIAIGNDAETGFSGQGSIAFGNQAHTDGFRSIAIGANSKADFDNSAAIGESAVATAANEIVLGGSTDNTYKLTGLNATSALDFVMVSPAQKYLTVPSLRRT